MHQLIYDKERKRATGVRIIDAETHQVVEYFAKVIFCCAVASTAILLNSTFRHRFPNGFGNDSGELGHNLMDHHFKVGAAGLYDGFSDRYYKGQRANGIYVPRFRNLDRKTARKDDAVSATRAARPGPTGPAALPNSICSAPRSRPT